MFVSVFLALPPLNPPPKEIDIGAQRFSVLNKYEQLKINCLVMHKLQPFFEKKKTGETRTPTRQRETPSRTIIGILVSEPPYFFVRCCLNWKATFSN